MDKSRRWRSHLLALSGYAACAIAFTWPLAAHLGTHLTGSPAGDTGVYIWNQWVFRHELLDGLGSPYFTNQIFSLTGRANLSLHNYTVFQNLLALPLIGTFGVVTTFNLVFLLTTVITGYAAFLLARQVTGRDLESWMAGLLFAWSPVLATRGGGHFSLVAAAPLPIFLLVLLRESDRHQLRDAVMLGAIVFWATTTDVYYAVYCILLALLVTVAKVITVRRGHPQPHSRLVPWALNVLVFCSAGFVLALIVSGGWQFMIAGRRLGVHSLYTPVLVLTMLAGLRAAWACRRVIFSVDLGGLLRLARLGAVGAIIATLLLSPVLYAVGVTIAEGSWDGASAFWRSSPRGVDLAAYILPNPNHPFAPEALRQWLTPRPDAYLENVASLTFVALLTLLIAWRAGWRLPRLWGGMALVFGALALGPFVHILGLNTYVPGPWSVFRYLPIVELARTPGRFSVVLMLAVAILFAGALCWLGERWPRQRLRILATIGLLLVFELLPSPRPLYSAAIPTIYRHVAAAPEGTRVLELPWGIRDGTMSAGNFTARSQYFQTMHGKALIGGYLSRVSRRRIRDHRRNPMLSGLMSLAEGRALAPPLWNALVDAGPAFIDRARIAFVVIDRASIDGMNRAFAIQAFNLTLVEVDGEFELYRPAAIP